MLGYLQCLDNLKNSNNIMQQIEREIKSKPHKKFNASKCKQGLSSSPPTIAKTIEIHLFQAQFIANFTSIIKY